MSVIYGSNGWWLGPLTQVIVVMTQQEMGRLHLIQIIGKRGHWSAIDAEQFPLTVFLKADFVNLTSLSHHTPHLGNLGVMNRHSMHSLRETPLYPLAEASKTGRSLEETAVSCNTVRRGIYKIGSSTFCSWSNTSSTIPEDHMFWMTQSYFTCNSGEWDNDSNSATLSQPVSCYLVDAMTPHGTRVTCPHIAHLQYQQKYKILTTQDLSQTPLRSCQLTPVTRETWHCYQKICTQQLMRYIAMRCWAAWR